MLPESLHKVPEVSSGQDINTHDKLFFVEGLIHRIAEGTRYLISDYETAIMGEYLFNNYLNRAQEVCSALEQLTNKDILKDLEHELRCNYLSISDHNNLIKYLDLVSHQIDEAEFQLYQYYTSDAYTVVNKCPWIGRDTNDALGEIRGIGKWYLKVFAGQYPDTYLRELSRIIKKYKNENSDNIPKLDEEISHTQGKEPDPRSNQSEIKLQWNGTNRALYDLFAQLSLQSTESNKPLIGNTIIGLAEFLSANVEGLPDAKTVERELQKMREPQGLEKAKRGRIDLDIKR